MISVVMSTYNRPERLERAIKSVLSQTYSDLELIVVDDGSEGYETKTVVEKYMKDKRVSYTRIGHFGCDTRPKNKGVSLSRGEFVAFCDDDVEYRPDHLAVLMKFMTPDLDAVYGDRFIYDNEKPVSIGLFHDYDPYLLLRRNYIDTSDIILRKKVVVEVGGFDERYKKYIDWNLWVRLAKAGKKFKRIPGVITNYHVYPDSKSNRKEDEKGFSKPAWDPMDCEIHVPHLSPDREPKVAVFSITYDRLEYTKKCFASLGNTAKYPFDHFVVDNGSTDGTVEWLRDEYKTKWHRFNPENMGISIASNQAVSKIQEWTDPYDIIIKVDPDCLFLTDGWMKTMVNLWKSGRMMAYSCYIQGLKDNPGGAPRVDYGQIKGEFLGLTRHLGGICVFADIHAYDNFTWDETSPLHGVQDLEFSTHLKKSGFGLAYLENYYAEHIDGTEGQQKRYPDYFERRKQEKVRAYEKMD